MKNTKTYKDTKTKEKPRKSKRVKPHKLSYWKKKAWVAFSISIRVSSADKDGRCLCYTCGKKYHWKELQAGHFTAGRSNSILFDGRQVRPQCYICNVCNHGEQYIFGEKLRKEVGEKVFGEILEDKHKTVKYSAEDFKRFENDFKFLAETVVENKNFKL